MTIKPDDDLANRPLIAPPPDDFRLAPGANAGHLSQPSWLALDDVEHVLAKRRHQLLCVDRADAFDHSRAEVLLEPLERRRDGCADCLRLELEPVLAVVDPDARRLDMLTGADRGSVPNHGHEVALSTGFDPEDAIAGLDAVEGNALDRARQLLRCPTLAIS